MAREYENLKWRNEGVSADSELRHGDMGMC